MNNPTKYVCPKCGHALRFTMMFWHRLPEGKECKCDCAFCGGRIGKGLDAKSAFEDWQNPNAQEAEKTEAANTAGT